MSRLFKVSAARREISRWILASLLFSACAQAQEARALLGTRRTDLDLTRDTTLDLMLPSGFVLSGKILTDDPTAVLGGLVLARSGEQLFEGPISIGFSASGLTATYRLVLPAGTYHLFLRRGILDLDSGSEGSLLSVTSDLSQMVTISGNRTLDLSLPRPPDLITLSGRIASAGGFPTKGFLSFLSSDRSVWAEVPFDRNYTVKLPPGSYTVQAGVREGDDEEMAYGSFFTLERITVNASGMRDFVLPPAVTLSGKVTDATGRPAVPSMIVAFQKADPASSPSGDPPPCQGSADFYFFLPPNGGQASIPRSSTTGAYALKLPAGTYVLYASWDLSPEPEQDLLLTSSAFAFSFLERSLETDAVQDFTAPPLPEWATLSGRITDERGQPVAGASPTAFSQALTNTPGAAFSTGTETDANGQYRLRVLSGTAYRLEVCPPSPPSLDLPPHMRRR